MPDPIFLSLLIFLIIFSCLFYGSVAVFPLTIIESVIGIMVMLWLTEMAHKRQITFKKSVFLAPIFLFLGFIIFQLFPLPISFIKLVSINTANLYEKFLPDAANKSFFSLSIYQDATISALIKLASYIGIFFLIINKIKNKKQADIIINLIIFFGLFVSVFGLVQRYADPGSRPFGPFGHRNIFAGYINLVIPLALGYSFTDISLSRRVLYAFSFGIMAVALFLSASRAGTLVFVAVLILLLFFMCFKENLKKKISILAILSFITILLFIFFMNSKVVWERLASLFNKSTYIVLGHGYSWFDVLRIWKDFPIFGTGLGTFGSISSMYKTTLTQVSYFETHNDYLQLLSETGLTGLILATLFFVLFFLSIIKIWLKRHDTYVICLVLGGMCSLLGMLVYSLLDFNLQIPANALLFFIIMGLVYRLAFLRQEDAIS